MYDYIIVGAGPAGSTAARGLALKGHRVLILDKQEFPHEVSCGHMVAPRVFEELDFDYPSDAIFTGLRAVEARTPYGKQKVFTQTPVAYVTKREKFDRILLDKAIEAGVEFKVQNIVDYHGEQGNFLVEAVDCTYSARNLVIATGSVSKLKNKIEVLKNKYTLLVTSVEAIRLDGPNDRFTLDFDYKKSRLAWIAPTWVDTYTLGICGDFTNMQDIKEATEVFARDNGFKLTQEVKGRILHSGNEFNHEPIERGIYLIGDAYNLVDPFTCEGIYPAVVSGKLLVEDPEEYYTLVRERFYKSIHKSNLIRWWFYSSPKWLLKLSGYIALKLKFPGIMQVRGLERGIS